MKRLLTIITICLYSFSIWATPSLLAPRHSVTLQDPKSGRQHQFMSDGFTYLKVETNPKEMANNPSWFVEVSMMTKAGTKVNNKKYKTSKKTLMENVALSLPPSQKVADTLNKENVLPKKDLNFVVEGRYVKNGWDYLQIYFVDSDGRNVDHNGIAPPDAPFRYYRLSTKIFDYHMAEGMINNLNKVNSDPFDTFYCPTNFSVPLLDSYTDLGANVQAPLKVQASPVKKPKPVVAKKPVPKPKPKPKKKLKSTYETMMEKRAWFLKTYPTVGKCLSALRNYEKKRNGNIWGSDVSLKKRASEIYKQSKATFSKLINHSKVTKKKSNSTGFGETHNPHMIHPLLSPELMSCIAFQETKGKLDPQAMNYSYCEQRNPMRSTAFGLSMITRTTLSDLRYYKPHKKAVNQLPITTVSEVNGLKLKPNMSVDKMIYALSDSKEVQMELMARTLNYTLKHYNWQKKLKSNVQKTLEWGVLKYDGDDKEAYLKNVVRTCVPCMKSIKKNGGDPVSCHNKMVK